MNPSKREIDNWLKKPSIIMDIFVNVFAACSNILMIIGRGPQVRHSLTTVDLLIINWQNIEMLMEMLLLFVLNKRKTS